MSEVIIDSTKNHNKWERSRPGCIAPKARVVVIREHLRTAPHLEHHSNFEFGAVFLQVAVEGR